MSIEITVYASDIKGLDELIEKSMDIKDYYGTALFDEDGRLIAKDDYEYFIEPTCHLGIMMDMQDQINRLNKTVEQLKHIAGWVSGYDDNDWPIEESLTKRVTKLEKEVEKL
tara:strand:- start:226 stop:561 length:336 start_codon:yes stop_codon:yes gene_type:complete